MKNLPISSNSGWSSFASINKAWALIPVSSKPQVILLAIIQTLVSLVDVLGIAFTGLVGVISVNTIQGGTPSNAVIKTLRFLQLENFSLTTQLQILIFITITVLIGKTVASIYFAKMTTRLLSNLAAATSSRILQEYFNLPFKEIRKLTQQEAIFATTRGVNTLIVSVIGSAVGLGVDGVLVLTLSIVLVAISPISGVVFILLFFAIWQILRKKLHEETTRLSKRETELSLETSNLISNTLDSFRELFVLNRLNKIITELGRQRSELSKVTAVTNFNPQFAKYVFEFGIVVISFAISAIQLWQYDASRAAGTIALFIAAGARISPALLRMQQNFLLLTSSAGVSEPTLALSKKLRQFNTEDSDPISEKSEKIDFAPRIVISNLKFGYIESILVLNNLNLVIEEGEFLAIVGPSGAGKSTLIDLCLGLQNPLSGKIEISGLSPYNAIQRWPGKIAYVPQRVHLSNSTLRDNLVFGADVQGEIEEKCIAILVEVGLSEEFARMQLSLDTLIGSDKNNLSGGQVQRIGIARALFSRPELLFLDEATSSLDAETENQISTMISNLPGRITRIVIAHRLSTVQAADRILYLSPSGDSTVGTFQELRDQIPDFDHQARLMGL